MGQRAGRRSLVWKEVGAGRVRRRGDGTRVSPRSRKQAQGRRREGAGARREVGPRSALGSHSLIRSFTLDDALQGKGPLARSLKSRRVGAEEDQNNPCLACSRAVRMGVPPSIARQLAAGARVDDRASAARIAAVRQKRREGADGKVCVAVVLGLTSSRLRSLFPHLGVSSVDRCRAARRTRPKLIHPENCQVLLGGGRSITAVVGAAVIVSTAAPPPTSPLRARRRPGERRFRGAALPLSTPADGSSDSEDTVRGG